MKPHTRALHLALAEAANGVLAALQRAVSAWKKWVEAQPSTSVESSK